MADAPQGEQPVTIQAYLKQLKACLRKQPAALVQDALADAEEYLRAERENSTGESEQQVLVRIINSYGSPQEVAEEYITMAQASASPFPSRDEGEASDGTPSFFGILIDPRAYGALLYMLFSLATGIFYFTWAVTGVSLSLGLSILIIGVPFALLFIGSVRIISWVEGRLVEALLGVRMPRRLPAVDNDGSIWSRIKRVLADGRTWGSLFYMILQLPLGIIYFCLSVVLGVTSGSVIAGAIYEIATGENVVRLDPYPELDAMLSTAPGLVALALVGFLGILLTLHLARAIGFVHGRIAEAMLVRA